MNINKDIFFGQQNFFFTDVNSTDGTYDYVAYMSAKGAILLARFSKTDVADTGRYCLTTGTYATIWTNRASQNYVLPNELKPVEF